MTPINHSMITSNTISNNVVVLIEIMKICMDKRVTVRVMNMTGAITMKRMMMMNKMAKKNGNTMMKCM